MQSVDIERFLELKNYLEREHNVRNNSQLCEIADIDRPSLSRFLNGKGKFSTLYVDRICKIFPEISRNWLLTGEGKMINFYPKEDKKEDYSAQESDIGYGRRIHSSDSVSALLQLIHEKDQKIETLVKDLVRMEIELEIVKLQLKKEHNQDDSDPALGEL